MHGAGNGAATDRDRKSGRFSIGNDARNGKRKRLVELRADLDRELGADLSAADRVLRDRVIELLARRPRSHNDTVRTVNAADRILERLRSRYAKDEIIPSLQELGL